MRIVVDTNLFVSALIQPKGIPAQILTHDAPFQLVTSEEILAEIERVLGYARIRRKYNLSDQTVHEYLARIRDDSEIIEVSKNAAGASPDPDDDKFLACAVDAGADYIVSGDPHLTSLGGYMGIPVLTPRQFLDRL